MENVTKNPEALDKAIGEAAIPLFGIRRDMGTCQRAGSQFRHLIWRLRNSKMSPWNYAQIRGIFREAEDLSGPAPINWEQW